MPAHRTRIDKICPICSDIFTACPGELKRGGGIYCSRECYHKAQSRPEAERFWEKVDKDGPIPHHCPEIGPCWVWTGAKKGGKWDYGMLGGPSDSRSAQLAHRVSWKLHHEEIADEICVLHRCDNPPCVRPEHLFLGTLKDNTQDMLKKDRHLPRKITLEQRKEIRERYLAGGITYRQIADEYGISLTLTDRLINNRPRPPKKRRTAE
jgi:hypothetical protein